MDGKITKQSWRFVVDKNKKFLAAGFLVSLFLAGVVSFYASSDPDGLEKVAEDIGFPLPPLIGEAGDTFGHGAHVHSAPGRIACLHPVHREDAENRQVLGVEGRQEGRFSDRHAAEEPRGDLGGRGQGGAHVRAARGAPGGAGAVRADDGHLGCL